MGQYEDVETRLIENRYRTLVPELGGYVSPDPLRSSSLQNQDSVAAYNYALNSPNKYIDADGRYALDSSWSPAAARTGRAALAALEADSTCKCYFRKVFGRVPFSDPFEVFLGKGPIYTAVEQNTGANLEAFSPFPASQTNAARNLGLTQPNLWRIEIGSLGGNTRSLKELIAHEMAHTSFNAQHAQIKTLRDPDVVGAVCGGVAAQYGFLLQDERVKECLQGGC